jgi:hypothetical protein
VLTIQMHRRTLDPGSSQFVEAWLLKDACSNLYALCQMFINIMAAHLTCPARTPYLPRPHTVNSQCALRRHILKKQGAHRSSRKQEG